MGTKTDPGRYDCYDAARPDEPLFVLLGRDRHASALVYLWAELRRREGEAEDKVVEALHCADRMHGYCESLQKRPATVGQILQVAGRSDTLTMNTSLSPDDAGLLRHALGMDGRHGAYRNYFTADRGSDDDRAWAGLVERGFAVLGRNALSPDNLYHVTEAGRDALRRATHA